MSRKDGVLIELSIKRCKKCLVLRHFSDYYASNCIGGVGSTCKSCVSAYARNRYQQKSDSIRANSRKWYQANKERALDGCRRRRAAKRVERPCDENLAKHKLSPNEQRRLRYEANKEAHARKVAAWRQANPEKVREISRASAARRRATPAGAMAKRVSKAVRRCLDFRGLRKGGPTFDALPYSPAELATHIERQFLKGMNWQNMRDWHIDHIVPLSSFAIESLGDAEFQRAWALSNLRPLWAAENIRKGVSRGMLV